MYRVCLRAMLAGIKRDKIYWGVNIEGQRTEAAPGKEAERTELALRKVIRCGVSSNDMTGSNQRYIQEYLD